MKSVLSVCCLLSLLVLSAAGKVEGMDLNLFIFIFYVCLCCWMHFRFIKAGVVCQMEMMIARYLHNNLVRVVERIRALSISG